MTGLGLLNVLLDEEVEFKENHNDLIREFDKALDEKRVYPIKSNNDVIGFLTWERQDSKVLINKCVIRKQFRERFSLISLRHQFREMFNNTQFYWKSKKRNKFCYVR